ncbi:MAG: hypothetical protein R3C59_04140 [Planctomycetaceae bacterium]
MQKASDVITAEQRAAVGAAVTAAESGSSCEIVPVVVSASGRYDRAEDLVGLWCAMLSAVIVFVTFPGPGDTGHWGAIPMWAQILLLMLIMAVSFVAGAVLADRLHNVRRLFTPRRHMDEEVNLKARQLFFDRRVHHTAGASGILIFVSLYERMAVVLGDRSVVETLGDEFLKNLCDRLTNALHSQDVAMAICETIRHAAPALESSLPRSAGDVNELSDALVLLD